MRGLLSKIDNLAVNPLLLQSAHVATEYGMLDCEKLLALLFRRGGHGDLRDLLMLLI